MAASFWKLCIQSNISNKLTPHIYISVRNGHHIRGKPPGVARSLEQRLAEIKHKDPELHYRVDIGLPHASYSRTQQLKYRLDVMKANRKNVEIEKLSRSRKLLINLDETRKEWLNNAGQYQIKETADHYGVFQHLFGDAYFVPRVPLSVAYDVDEHSLESTKYVFLFGCSNVYFMQPV